MSTSPSGRIQRGRACLSCYMKKKKCDGGRPSCGNCIRTRTCCEYAPLPPIQVPTGQVQIQALQYRVEELETVLNGMSMQPSSSSTQSAFTSSPLIDPHTGEVFEWLQDILRPTIIANRRHYSLYLDIATLRTPPRPLLHAMNLVACHILSLSATPNTHPTLQELGELKSILLKRVHDGIHISLEGAQDLISGVVCAPALAAQYLLQIGKFAEAHWLASSAVRFAVSCGLHTIVGYRWIDENVERSPGSTAPSGSGNSLLVPAANAREHYDRCMSWWLAFAADGMVEIAGKLPSALRPELRACIGDVESGVGRTRSITTPFPLAENGYELSLRQLDTPGHGIKGLFSESHSNSQDPSTSSVFAIRLKSIAFFEMAAVLYDDSRVSQSLGADVFQHINHSISRFIESLPGLTYYEPTHTGVSPTNGGPVNPNIILAYMLLYTAKIYLLSTRISTDFPEHRLNAALSVGRLASALDVVPDRSIAPLIARCCLEAIEVAGPYSGHTTQLPEVNALHSLLNSLPH